VLARFVGCKLLHQLYVSLLACVLDPRKGPCLSLCALLSYLLAEYDITAASQIVGKRMTAKRQNNGRSITEDCPFCRGVSPLLEYWTVPGVLHNYIGAVSATLQA